MTMGRRAPEAQWSSSCISARPWELVAVKVREPAAAAPMHVAMAECSDSTMMKRAGISPQPQASANRSAIDVCGVIG